MLIRRHRRKKRADTQQLKMNYNVLIKKQHREYATKIRWVDAVMLVSLDIASYFTVELGLGDIYSSELQCAARDLLRAKQVDGVMETFEIHPIDFQELITARCGADILRKFENWLDKAIPVKEQVKAYRHWQRKFHDLVMAWNKKEVPGDVPFNSLGEAHQKLLIRDYLTHLQNILREVSIAERVYTEWDNWTNKLYEEDGLEYPGILVNQTCDHYYPWNFWRSSNKQITAEQASQLSSWAELPLPHKKSRSDA